MLIIPAFLYFITRAALSIQVKVAASFRRR
jgi:hypothetical protein